MEAKRTYFPGLNALRFFAATLVIFHHLEQYKFWGNQDSLWGNSFIDAMGHKPVGLFFVLSGYLITYLLLEENRDKHSINIGQFYLKRVFRIWPLYFLIVIIALSIIPLFSDISFAALPAPDSPTIFISLILILPNLLRISFPTLVGANQLWSVGIEEQFYLFWPLLIKQFQKNIIGFLYSFIGIKIAIHLIILFGLTIRDTPWLSNIEILYSLFPVEQMAVGALGAAFLFYKKESILKYMGSPTVAIIATGLIIGSSFVHLDYILTPLLESVLFVIIIYQITINKKIHKPLENKTLHYLGSISYGIYMWHTIAITISMTVMDLLGWNSSIIVCLSSLAITLLFSHLSFKYLESPILKLRKYYERSQKPTILSSVTNA